MSNALLADISSWQPTTINWPAYAAWSQTGDGVPRAIMRASEGVGVPDSHFDGYWSGATAAGVEVIGVYHYAYPGLHPGTAGAVQEADYFLSVVGTRLRSNDFYMLDFEEAAGTAIWALAFLTEIEQRTGRTPYIYASLSYVAAHLQDPALARFPLVLADWTFDPNSRPAAPAPWASYQYLQYSDQVNISGIGVVDADVFLGGVTMVPTGPFVFPTVGKEILKGTTLAQIAGAFGLPVSDIVALNPWAASYNPTLAGAIDGLEIKLPGYPVAASSPINIPAMQADATAIQTALADLVSKLSTAASGNVVAQPAAVATPASAPASASDSTATAAAPKTYTVQVGDTLISIADKLGLTSWFSDLYQPNMADIEAAARAAGLPNSDMGAHVPAGTVLTLR